MPFWTRSWTCSPSKNWAEYATSSPGHDVDSEKVSGAAATATVPLSNGATLPPPVLHNTDSHKKRRKSARIGTSLSIHWERFKRRIGSGTAPSTSSLINDSSGESNPSRHVQVADGDSELVDEVVVDRAWSEEIKSSVSHSEHGGTPEKSGGSHPQTGPSDHDSTAVHEGSWGFYTPLIILRWRVLPAIAEFFNSRFVNEKSEQHYAMEDWFLRKSLALWSAIWLIINWALGCGFVPQPFALADKIFYFAVAPASSVPIALMVMYDWPRDRPFIYQSYLVVAVWAWAFYQVLYMYLCGNYNPSHRFFECGPKDFLGIFYYSTAMQTIGLFGLKLNRLSAAIGASIFFVVSCALIIPDHLTWVRLMINFAVFHIFLLYVHYMREASERRLYTLRDQLKIQYKAKQKAQINERKAADSKRRLTSYVFHDKYLKARSHSKRQSLRPHNTVLAVQNMEASGTVVKDQEIEFKALEGSLSMMSKVLNDVLDFNRMDSGKFESASRPYAFHQVMRSLFIPLRLATDARGLEFVTDLDLNIDIIARRAAYEAMGKSSTEIHTHTQEDPDEDGVVTGDETRLRQVITNLASNACKFTPSGGKLSITTRLVLPSLTTESEIAEVTVTPGLTTTSTSVEPQVAQHPLSATHLNQHNQHHGRSKPPLEWIVVRIEVTDTGYGIRPQDMAQLFSAFNQTEQGRQQGGKGTGLGLALVRSIVKLSGGRLGVRSKVGEGSTFWVELPLGVGRNTLETGGPPEIGPKIDSKIAELGRTRHVKVSNEPLPAELQKSRFAMTSDSEFLPGPQQLNSMSTRSSSVLHSLMEQGGRVELVLATHDSNTSIPTRTIGDRSTGTDIPSNLLSPAEEIFEGDASFHPPLGEHSSGDDASKQMQVERPTYVPLPTPRTFTQDSHPTSSTSTSTTSANLPTMFDNNYTRGNLPASNPPILVEPGMSVLVVDDDPLTRTLMKRILTRLGCSVSTAENGEVALEMILGANTLTPNSDTSRHSGPILEQERPALNEEGKFAVVFLDNQMPVMSGLKAVAKLRGMGRKDFVVGVTGNALLTDQQEYLEAGVDQVLTKPVLERSLRDILVQAGERQKRNLRNADRPS